MLRTGACSVGLRMKTELRNLRDATVIALWCAVELLYALENWWKS